MPRVLSLCSFSWGLVPGLGAWVLSGLCLLIPSNSPDSSGGRGGCWATSSRPKQALTPCLALQGKGLPGPPVSTDNPRAPPHPRACPPHPEPTWRPSPRPGLGQGGEGRLALCRDMGAWSGLPGDPQSSLGADPHLSLLTSPRERQG